MTKYQRVENVIIGLIMLISGAVMLFFPEDGFYCIAMILAGSLILKGVQSLIYYFTMARFMVGGKAVLFSGVVILDFGIFTMSMVDEPKIYILVYLIIFHGFSAVVNLLKGLREKKTHTGAWKVDLSQGSGNLLIILACFLFRHSDSVLVALYCGGLFYSAALRILCAVRKNDIVYIQ